MRTAWSRVFPVSPVATREPIDVEFSVSGDRLESSSSSVWGCSPTEVDDVAPWRLAGECHPVRRVRADQLGDFWVPLPTLDYEDGFHTDDEYAEVSLYYHTERFAAVLSASGYALPCEHTKLQGNYTFVHGEGILAVDNAYYIGSCDERPMAIFGQGEFADYAYDGDVIYHELGHGVIDAHTPWGLWRTSCNETACSDDAGTIGEALADYMVVMLTGDPHIAEYVAQREGRAAGGIRNLDVAKRCPGALTGEIHADSELVGSALWAARQQLGPRLDAFVLDSLNGLAEDARFEDFAEHLITTAAPDPVVAQTLADIFADWGLLDCPRVIPFEAGHSLFLAARPGERGGVQPAPLQIEVEIPEGAAVLRLGYEAGLFGLADGDAVPVTEPVIRAWVGWQGPVVFSETRDERDRPVTSGPAEQQLLVRVVSQTRRELVLDVTGAGDRVWIALGNSLTFAPMEATLTTLAFDEASASGCRVAPSSRSRGFLLWVGLTLVAFGCRRREARGRGAR